VGTGGSLGTPRPEGVGPLYTKEGHRRAQALTREAVEAFARSLKPGCREEDGHRMLKEHLERAGAENFWHPQKLRFGRNTTKSFREISDPDVTLREDDIFFVDIGPVFGGFEGDYGRTFVVGSPPAPMREAGGVAEAVFRATAEAWLRDGLDGVRLYEFAANYVKRFPGFGLDTRMSGHRVGDFPHALHHKGKLLDFTEVPTSGLWILEILVRHESGEFGAFFEDLLERA